jgi:uncharacterized protein YjbI with pentapeptide repeats
LYLLTKGVIIPSATENIFQSEGLLMAERGPATTTDTTEAVRLALRETAKSDPQGIVQANIPELTSVARFFLGKGLTERTVHLKINALIEAGEVVREKRGLLRVTLPLDLRGQTLPQRKLAGEDLRGRDARGADFSGGDLHQADFTGANLVGACFHGADLQGACFRSADLNRADLSDANLSGASLRQAEATKTNFSGANLEGADLREVTAFQANFAGARLTNARADGASFAYSDFRSTDMKGFRRQNLFDHREFDAQLMLDQSAWDVRWINNNRHILGWTIHQIIGPGPDAEWMFGRTVLAGLGCWQRIFEQWGGFFPHHFERLIQTWRQRAREGTFDPASVIQAEMELRILRARLEGKCRDDYVQTLVDISPNRLWRAWTKWNLTANTTLDRLVRTPQVAEEIAGTCAPHFLVLDVELDLHIRPHTPPDLPPDKTRALGEVLDRIGWMGPEELVPWMRELT